MNTSNITTGDPRPDAKARGIYPITFDVTLNGVVTDTDEVTIPLGADYLVRFATHDVRDAAAAQTLIANPNVLVSFKLNSTQGEIQNVAMPIGSIAAANMQNVKEWAAPLLLGAGTTLIITFSNQVAANYRVRLTLHGFKFKGK